MKAKRKKVVKKIKKATRKPARKVVSKRAIAKRTAASKAKAGHAKALTRIENYLADHKVHYELIRHQKAYTAQELAAVEHVSGKKHVKVVVVTGGGKHALAALAASARVDFKKLGRAIGRSVSLAKESDLKILFPDCDVGAMPPLGSLYDLPLFVDKLLAQNAEIVFQGGIHTVAIKIAYADFVELESPKLADFAQPFGT